MASGDSIRRLLDLDGEIMEVGGDSGSNLRPRRSHLTRAAHTGLFTASASLTLRVGASFVTTTHTRSARGEALPEDLVGTEMTVIEGAVFANTLGRARQTSCKTFGVTSNGY